MLSNDIIDMHAWAGCVYVVCVEIVLTCKDVVRDLVEFGGMSYPGGFDLQAMLFRFLIKIVILWG